MHKLINYEDHSLNVNKDDKGNVSLTDLWKLSGSEPNKAPQKWQRQDQTVGFLRAVTGLLKVDLKSLFNISKGRNGSTFAHPQVALEYAQYLDPKLAVAVNQAFFERIEEEKNPDLIADRYIRTYKKKGKDDEWIKKRFESKSTRNLLTSKLKVHGVQHEGYRNCTNAIYTPLYGGTSNVVREKKGLSRGENIRDNLSKVELAAIELAELLTVQNIENGNLRGNAQCELAAMKAGRAVATALNQNNSNR